MQKPAPQNVFPPIPAAQYVRMSDENQQYSIDNQKAAIKEYADAHGLVVVKTYADPGKSGVAAAHRKALRQLLKDVVSGDAEYKTILVYDVSRWGRFPNNDEAAHYEFLCSNSGIPLHYCAEPFTNDGTATSSLLKALKRSMAAEYSRELSEKVIRGKTRLVQLGYWVSGQAAYGFRRRMVSATGKLKDKMKFGEQKSLTTDRVILVHGPSWEVKNVRLIFTRAIQGIGCAAIARELKRRHVLCDYKHWTCTDVHHIVTNPTYAGWNIWNRSSERLQTKRTRNPKEQWITKSNAFAPIVDQATFDLAQANRPKKADYLWSDKEMLQRLRRLLKLKGRLSEGLILKSKGMPTPNTLHHHFGSYRKIYEMVGFHLDSEDVPRGDRTNQSLILRRKRVAEIKGLFPDNVTVTHLSSRTRSVLVIDRSFMVSLLLCRSKVEHGKLIWAVEPKLAESDFITLVCTMNATHDDVIDYFLLPNMRPFRRFCFHDGRLRTAERLGGLLDFYPRAKKMWSDGTSHTNVQRTSFP